MKILFKRLFKTRQLIPLNIGGEDCPELNVGDVVVGITEDDSWDYIAGMCRMNPLTKKGLIRKFKVIKILSDGDALLKCGNARTIINKLNWDDGNRVTIPQNLMHSEIKIRFYKEVYN